VLGNAVNYSVNDMLYKSMFENNDIEKTFKLKTEKKIFGCLPWVG